MKARNMVRELDPTNDITFLRIKSKQHEVLISPEKDSILIVIQDHALIESSKS
jgi:dynein light chain roadblock-type